MRQSMLKLATVLFLSVATSTIHDADAGSDSSLEAKHDTNNEILGASIFNDNQSPLLYSSESKMGVLPELGSPWTHRPICTEYRPVLNSILCVYTDATFNDGRGISIFTTPQFASQIAEIINSLKATGSPSTQDRAHSWTASPIPNKGIGVLATTSLSRGNLILSSHPMLILHTEKILHTTDEREKFLRLAVSQLPQHSQEQFYGLAKMCDDETIIAQDVAKSNAFDIEVGGVKHVAVFSDASRFNHACSPNAQYYLSPDTLSHTVHATRPIKPDEEITIAYVSPFRTYAARQKYLQKAYNFTCSCSRCQDGKTADEQLRKITDFQAILGDWTPVSPSAGPSNTPSIKLAEQLIRIYNDLGLEGWLDYAYGNAALMYNSIGGARGAKKYAKLAAESAKLRYDPAIGDVAAWTTFEADVRWHWSWMARKQNNNY